MSRKNSRSRRTRPVAQSLVTGAVAAATLAGAQSATAATASSWASSGVTTLTSAMPLNCGAVKSPYDYTQQAASACFPTDTLMGISTLADGGHQYRYQTSTGATTSILVPPVGFDPVTASAAEIAQYGLPPRPTSADALAEWQKEVSNDWWATPPVFLAEIPAAVTPPAVGMALPANRTKLPVVPRTVDSLRLPRDLSNSDQVGFYTPIPNPTYGSSASATYFEPDFDTNCANYGFAVYAGLQTNPGPNQTFGQDGTSSMSDEAYHNAFYQVWGGSNYGGSDYLQYIPVGDVVRANVNYPANEYTGSVTNVTTGEVNSWTYASFGDAPSQGEAIVEHIQGVGLPNFQDVDFPYTSVNGAYQDPTTAQKLVDPTNGMGATYMGIDGSFGVNWNHC